MMIRTLCISAVTFFILGLSFDSHAVSCNRNAEVHKSRAQNIMSKTHSSQVVTKDDEEFMLCMLQEKEDKQDFQARVQNNRENERRRAAAEAERQRLAEIERNRPYRSDECAGGNLPCGHACFTPGSGQACVTGQVICTPRGLQLRLCWPTAAQRAGRAKLPLITDPDNMWAQITIPPHSKSDQVIVPVGYALTAKGENFKPHTVFTDGRQCSWPERCSGAIAYMYFTNESDTVNTVRYAFGQ